MIEEHSLSENWKNGDVSEKQLELNLRELSSPDSYPSHWNFFLRFMTRCKYAKMLDIGCGVGAYAKLIKDNGIETEYTGIDYSEYAIQKAKEQWGTGNFICMDYRGLTPDFIRDFDLVHLGALLDVLPNGNEALDFILSLGAKEVLISRIETTKEVSHYKTYYAYDIIETYSYRHNPMELINCFEKNGYDFEFEGANIILKKI